MTVTRARLDDAPQTFFGYACNLSRGGIGIETLRPRQPGSQFELEFTLPEPLGSEVRCRCEVVWARESGRSPGMGLRFLDLEEEIASAIDGWIRAEAWNASLRP